MKRHFLHLGSTLFIAFVLAACGGGGGGGGGGTGSGGTGDGGTGDGGGGTGDGGTDGDVDAPFGLTERPSLSSFDLPLEGASTGDFTLVNAYPNIQLSGPMYLAGVPGDSRVVVMERNGRLVTFTDSPNANDLRVILDITERVVTDAEQGLLGMAFDPDFSQTRYIYLHYSIDNAGQLQSVISRMTWNALNDLVEPSSEKVILRVDQPFNNHNGGMLAFGPDDYLYVALGDGGSGGDPQNNGQDRGTLLGSLLRLDVHPSNDTVPYSIPTDNPFVGENGVREEIYASGLRNPWRFSFDRQTGELWLGDVGQSDREEINIITAGGNYGWRVFEGSLEFNRTGSSLPDSAFTPPIFEYDHSLGRAVIGGYVYRGSNFASLFGRYLYSDSNSANIWALSWDGTQATSELLSDQGDVRRIVSFGETNNAEIRAVSLLDRIWKLSESGGSGEIPILLSQTGLFSNLADLTPASGLIEYAPVHPFWSDGTEKRRWVGVPDAQQVEFTDEGWTFPVGTTAVKHFEINLTENEPASARRLETRVLLNTNQGWLGFTYRWNENGTDATLLTGRETETLTINLAEGGTRDQLYEYPSRTACLDCHTVAAGFTLGLKTPQMNSEFNYSGVLDNQLRSWNNVSMFDADIGNPNQYRAFAAPDDTSATLQARARAYLDVNCSSCHQPEGPANTNLDLRELTSNTAMNAIGITPSTGDLGIANARIIAAGSKERSVLWQRIRATDGNRMPPLSTHLVDDDGVALIGSWIDSL